MLKAKCPAKINITLDILGVLPNGYHKVSMLMQTVSLYDEIILTPTTTGDIVLKCNISYIPVDSRNSAYKAAELFFNTQGLQNKGIKINIFKKIPVAAGLAGGSVNAAGVLLLLDKMYNTQLSLEQLCSMGEKIGADVPFCILGGGALSEGIGEILTKTPIMPNCSIILAKPKKSLSTALVYKEIDKYDIEIHPKTELVLEMLNKGDINGICRNMYNVMEPVSVKLCKDVGRFKDIMNRFSPLGCVMSGSGPTVFAVFDNNDRALECLRALESEAASVFLASPCNGIEIVKI